MRPLLLATVPSLLGLDPGDVVALGLGSLAVLTAALAAVAARWPSRRGLFGAQLAGLGLCLLLYGPLASEPADMRTPALALAGLLLQAALLLGAWLNAVRGARRARMPAGQRAWLALAVAALQALLALAAGQGRAYAGWQAPGRGQQVALVLLSLLEVVASWGLVGWQLRGRLPLAVWRPWWLAPLLAASLTTAYSSLLLWLSFEHPTLAYLTPEFLLLISAPLAAAFWLWSVLALLVLRPARAAPDYPASQST